MILVSQYLVPKGYLGLTCYPFVFLKFENLKTNTRLLNHENIHLKQQLELLILPFFLVYFIEFLVRLFQYKKWDLAYRNISFEREAYINESDLEYLKQRRFWCFLRYLRSHEL